MSIAQGEGSIEGIPKTALLGENFPHFNKVFILSVPVFSNKYCQSLIINSFADCCFEISSLRIREIFKNEDRDFLRPGTRRGGGQSGGKKDTKVF